MNNFIYRIKRKFGIESSAEHLEFYRNQGIKIGKGTVAFTRDFFIDTQRPWMIEIGEYCKLTEGVIILQHDYSRSVLRRCYGDIIGESKKTLIGNNVFIGINSIILMGANIGNNVIIGAGSVVSGTVPNNVVIAGNPAIIIRTLDEHYKIRKEKTCKEALDSTIEFFKTYNRWPNEKEIGSFWQLFLPKDKNLLNNAC